MESEIIIVNPRHPNAPEDGQGHIFAPNGNLMAGARLLEATQGTRQEIDIAFQDLNLQPLDLSSGGAVLVGAMGVPYWPDVIRIKEKVREVYGKDAPLIVGGQVFDGLTMEQFRIAFGTNVHNGNDDHTLKRVLGIDLHHLPDPNETPLSLAWEKIPDDQFKLYMEHEFALYVSQGCKKGCNFCAAKHTRVDQAKGNKAQVKEKYRKMEVVDNEIRYLVQRAKRLGITKLKWYLSNLDLFQSPDRLLEFAKMIVAIKRENPGFEFEMRALAIAESFLLVHNKQPEVLRMLIDAGLRTVGFGIDGGSKEEWSRRGKKFSDRRKCTKAVELTRAYGMTPQVLDVLGGEGATQESLNDRVHYMGEMVEKYGADGRQHSERKIPGSRDFEEDPAYGAELICDPSAGQRYDFTMLPDSVIVPDWETRQAITAALLQMQSLSPGSTKLLMPCLEPTIDEDTRREYRKANEEKYDS